MFLASARPRVRACVRPERVAQSQGDVSSIMSISGDRCTQMYVHVYGYIYIYIFVYFCKCIYAACGSKMILFRVSPISYDCLQSLLLD